MSDDKALTVAPKVSRRMTRFTVYDPATGEVLRTGYGPAHIVARNAKAGEAILTGVCADTVADRVTVAKDGVPHVARRSTEEVEARKLKPLPPLPSVLDLMEALKAKGTNLTPLDLEVARATRVQRASAVRA